MSNNNLYAFILSFLASIATFIGALFVFIKTNDSKKIVITSLSFAAGVMFFVSFFDLIPSSFKLMIKHHNMVNSIIVISLSISIGIIISKILDYYISINSKNNKLYKIGIINMVAIVVHNIPEGIITFLSTTSNIKIGIALSFAIAMHNVPEGISISIPIYYSTKSKKKALLYTLISAVGEIVGTLIASLFLLNYINSDLLAIIYALTAGIMIYISMFELLVNSLEMAKIMDIILYFITGSFIMLISHSLLNLL